MLHFPDILIYQENNPLLFSQYLFLFFFSVMFVGFTLLQKSLRLRNLYLLLFSLFFYYKCSGMYFFLLIFSTLVDYGTGFAIHKAKSKWKSVFFLVLSMISNLGLLGFYKYSKYIVELTNQFLGTDFHAVNFLAQWSNALTGSEFDISQIIIPVGISFYTFQTMSYSIDIFRKKIEPCNNVLDFAFFVSFFPQLVAGPIVRASEFIPQIRKSFFLSKRIFSAAIFLIMAGLIKKVFISDYISVNFVDRVFEDPLLYTGFMNLMAIYGYSIQIYCDFSGYSDMAIGLAALMGFRLPINFNSPYKAVNITEFWRRWHISLSSWLRDYLYISLGGNRRGKIRTYVNLMLTMLLGGLWHGAATKFIIWGGLHGLGLAVHKGWMKLFKSWSGNFSRIFGIVLTFHFVAFCWLYFRADDMETVRVMLKNIGTNFNFIGIKERITAYDKVFSVILVGFILHYLPNAFKSALRLQFIKSHMIIKVFIFALVIFITYQATSDNIQPFIYFQF